MDFNRYYNNAELKAVLDEWAETHPTLVDLSEIGKSYEGKPIWMLTLSNKETGADTDKPAVWIDANIHATEIAGTTTALRVAHELLSKYGEDDQVTRILDTSTFYIMPRVNPDGAAWAMADKPKQVRSGVRPYPFEDTAEGLYAEDIDGDGKFLQMRIPDPNGDWKVSTLNPRLMEKRAPDEHGGNYYRLLPEGLIRDYDGHIVKIARNLEGLDFNRNFPHHWRPENEQRGAGPYPTSEPEIRALVDFIAKHNNINAAIAYHTFSGVILRPYGTMADQDMDQDDLWTFNAIGERAEKLTGYKTVSVYHDFRYHPKTVIGGVFDDWIYDYLGVYGYTIELWDIVGRAGVKDRKFIDWWRTHPHEEDVLVLEWAEKNGPEDGYVDWYPFEHPQLGQIELGGWNRMFTWRNPPHAFMGEEAERNVPYALALADMLPHLTTNHLEAKALGNQTFQVDLVVENTGFFPSYTSNQSKKRSAARKVRVEIDLPEGATFVQGKAKTEIGHLEGRSNKLSVFSFFAPGTDNRGYAQWVINVPEGGEVTLNILSDRAGSLKKTVELS